LPSKLKDLAIAPEGGREVRNYGIIGGTLDALGKLIKKLQQPGVELRLVGYWRAGQVWLYPNRPP